MAMKEEKAKCEGDQPAHPLNLGHCERKTLATDGILSTWLQYLDYECIGCNSQV